MEHCGIDFLCPDGVRPLQVPAFLSIHLVGSTEQQAVWGMGVCKAGSAQPRRHRQLAGQGLSLNPAVGVLPSVSEDLGWLGL